MNKLILAFFSLSFLFSCSKIPNPEGLEWEYGKNEYNIEINAEVRNFLIHVPANYNGDEKVPVIFMLHGSSGTGTRFYNISGWVEKADEENFIAVFPTGLEYPLKEGGKTTKWSSDGLENDVVEGTEIKDDVPFIESLIEYCAATFNIDRDRLYICGFSNGGGFVKSQVLPRMSSVFAAVSAAGGVGLPQGYSIEGNRIAPFYNISGTLDDRIMEAIGVMEELPISAEEIENHAFLWPSIETMCDMLSLDYTYTEEQHIPDYNLMIFDDKKTNNGSEFVLMMVKSLQHRFPNGENNPRNVNATDQLWEWFSKYKL